MTPTCPVCGGTRLRVALRNVPELRFGLPDRFDLQRCLACGTYVTTPVPAPDYLERLYEEHYVPPHYVAPDADAIRAAVADLRSGGTTVLDRWKAERSTEVPALFLGLQLAHLFEGCRTVLDVGAYTGENMHWLSAGGWLPTGIEPNPHAAEVARASGLDVRNGYLEDAHLPDGAFDAAYLSYVIEHVAEPRRTLQELRRVLRPGGRLLLTTHNVHSVWRYIFGPYWINWHTPFHLYHSHPHALRRMVEAVGFTTLSISTRTPAFWLLMSFRAARDGVLRGSPQHRLYEPISGRVNRWLGRLLRLENAGLAGDCTIAVFERT